MKKTRIVIPPPKEEEYYVCDYCGKERHYNTLRKCRFCQKDICGTVNNTCSQIVWWDLSGDSSYYTYCKNCYPNGVKLQKELEEKKNAFDEELDRWEQEQIDIYRQIK